MNRLSNIVIAVALGIGMPAMAQTSVDTALPLQEGDNCYATSAEVFWEYTSPTDNATLMELSSLNGSTLTAYLSDGSMPSQSQVMDYVNMKEYVLVGPEQKVYISARGGYGSQAGSGFNARLTVSTNLGLGFVPDYPIVIENGGMYMISNGTASTTDYELERYFYYEPEESGVLVFAVSGYITLRYANRNSTEYVDLNGSYSVDDHYVHYEIPVNEGEPILLLATSMAGNCHVIETSQMTRTSGDGSKPSAAFVLGEENTVPAHFGTYWYRYDAKETGYVVVSSEAQLPGGTVNYYGSSTAYKEYSSQQGSMDLRFQVVAGMSYYLTIDKIESTQEETPFVTRYEEEQVGDDYHRPIVLEFDDEGRASFTTPAYSNMEYFYAVDMQSPDDVFELKVRCTTPASQIADYSRLIVYPFGNMMYGSGLLYGGEAFNRGSVLVTDWSLAEGNGGNIPAGRYFISVAKYEYVPLTFTVEKVSVEAGDVLGVPIVLNQTGIYEIPAKDEVYYSFTAPQNGTIVLALDDPQLSASFYKDGNPISVTQKGLEYRIKTMVGETYAFCIRGGGEGLYTFSIAMNDFAPGESADTPIPVEGDIVLGDTEVDVWYLYTVQDEGILAITANLTDHEANVGYILNHVVGERPVESSIIRSINESADLEYRAEVHVKAGDRVSVHIRTVLPQPGLGVQFALRGSNQGESLDNPYVLTVEEPLCDFLLASRQQPIYVRIPVKRGEIRVWSTLLSLGTLYADAALSQEKAIFTTSRVAYDKNNIMCFYLDAMVEEELTDYYLVLTEGGGQGAKLELECRSGQGIEQIDADEHEQVLYDLLGRRMKSGKGVRISSSKLIIEK